MSKTKRNIIIIVAAVVAAIGIILAIVLPLTLHKDETFTVTFNSNGGSIVASLKDVPYNSKIDEPTPPTREGHEFAGWFSDVQLKTQWRFDKNKVKSDLILYAKWNYNATNGMSMQINGGKEYTITGIGSATNESNILIPEMFNNLPVTAIADNAFESVTTIQTVYVPQSIINVGKGAFKNAENLTSVTFAGSDTVLGESLFDGCAKLQNVSLPDGLTKIAFQTFYGCAALTTQDIPATVTEIGDYAFYGCSALTDVNFPSALTSIGARAYAGCTALTEVALPRALESLGEAAFSRCVNLESLSVVGAGSGRYYSDGNCIIDIGVKNGEAYRTVALGCKTSNLPAITSPVHAIGDYAFSGCSDLTNIHIPATVTAIGDAAFANCSSLANVSIPASVETVGDYAFSGCTVLHNVTFGENSKLQRIGRESFSYCYGKDNDGLNIVLPNSLQSVGAGAFYNYPASSLNFLSVTYDGTIDDFRRMVESVPDGEDNKYTNSISVNCKGGGSGMVTGIA